MHRCPCKDILTFLLRHQLERLRKKNWNFKTPFTHGLRYFLAKTRKSKLKYIKNGLNNMLSDLSKSALKMALEDLQKNIAKKYEKHEIVRLR